MAEFDYKCDVCSKEFSLRLYSFHQHISGHILKSIKKVNSKLFKKSCAQLFSPNLKPLDHKMFTDMQIYSKLSKIAKFYNILKTFKRIINQVSCIEILSFSDSESDIMQRCNPKKQRAIAKIFGTSLNSVPVDDIIIDTISQEEQDMFDCLHSIRQSCIDRPISCGGQPESYFGTIQPPGTPAYFEIRIDSPEIPDIEQQSKNEVEDHPFLFDGSVDRSVQTSPLTIVN